MAPTPCAFALTVNDPLGQGLARAFGYFRERAAEGCALLLVATDKIPADLPELVVRELGTCPDVRELALVHPNPALGFLTSSIGLRVPRVRVFACDTFEAAKAQLGGRLSAAPQ